MADLEDMRTTVKVDESLPFGRCRCIRDRPWGPIPGEELTVAIAGVRDLRSDRAPR